jgi:hypothetical protein
LFVMSLLFYGKEASNCIRIAHKARALAGTDDRRSMRAESSLSVAKACRTQTTCTYYRHLGG